MTGVGSEHTNVDCKSWRKLSAPSKFGVTPRLNVWTNPLFLDQLRRSDAVQERAVLNETPEVAEISYFFFLLFVYWFFCLTAQIFPPTAHDWKLSLLYLFLSASTKRCQALTLLATQKATGGESGGGGTGTEWVSETVAWSIELKSAAFKEKRINKSNPRGGHLIWAEKRGGGFQVEKSLCARFKQLTTYVKSCAVSQMHLDDAWAGDLKRSVSIPAASLLLQRFRRKTVTALSCICITLSSLEAPLALPAAGVC